MRGASLRALTAAIEIWTRWEVERERTPLDKVVSAEFRSRKYLNSSERRWVGESLYGCMRFLSRQNWIAEQLQLAPSPEVLLKLWVSGPCNPQGELSEGVEFLPEGITQESLSEALEALPKQAQPEAFLRITLSCPDAIASELEQQLGAEAVIAGMALNAQAPTTLRVNTLKATRTKVMATLPEAIPTRYSPWGLELPHRVNVFDLPGFREGRFEIQEEASQLAVLLTNAQPGQTIVEVGAGAGGKTLALAALMANQGKVIAIDTSVARLEALLERAKRAGANGIRPCLVAVDENGIWQPTGRAKHRLEALHHAADRVFLDAPCSGSGVIRRNPDTKWRPIDIPTVTQQQLSLLAQASSLVAPGGSLFYVSCAIEREQNEGVIETFLQSEAGQSFQIEPISLPLEANPELDSLIQGPFLRTWPHRHGLDAFFAACLKRTP